MAYVDPPSGPRRARQPAPPAARPALARPRCPPPRADHPTDHGSTTAPATDHAAATPDHGPGDLVRDLGARLVIYLAEHAPAGRIARSRVADALLARACVVPTDWETAYRTGRLLDHTAALYGDPDTTVHDLLDAVADHQVTELVELAIRADRTRVLARLAGGISGPVFAEHWADGDLLIPAAAGGGMVLLDVKTVTSARDPDRVARWLWQLQAYVWLDTDDHYRIRSVGLYLARHAVLRTCRWIASPPERRHRGRGLPPTRRTDHHRRDRPTHTLTTPQPHPPVVVSEREFEPAVRAPPERRPADDRLARQPRCTVPHRPHRRRA